MVKKQKEQKGTDYRGIALIILALGGLYILATNIVALIVTIVVLAIIVLAAAYFILPRLGIMALSGLLGSKGV